MEAVRRPEAITVRAVDGSIVKLEHFDALRSTLDVARQYALDGVPDRYVVFTDKKIEENGDITEGLYMSLVLRPSIFASQAHLLGAMSATAFVTALEEHTTKRLGLGWVSDLYCEGALIGDVSIEGKIDAHTGYEHLIITFSAKLDKRTFPPRLTDMIKKVFESNNASIAMIIGKSVINNFLQFYQHIKTSNKFMEIYTKKFILRGTRIKHIEGGKKRTRRILGVDTKTGALILEGTRRAPRHGAATLDTRIFVTSPRAVIMPKKVKIKD